MSESAKMFIPALIFAAGAGAVGCAFELWDRARSTRSDTDSKNTSSNGFYYAAIAGMFGAALMFRGVELHDE